MPFARSETDPVLSFEELDPVPGPDLAPVEAAEPEDDPLVGTGVSAGSEGQQRHHVPRDGEAWCAVDDWP